MRDEYEDALSIGLENEEMIRLGKAWCTRIRTDHTPFGVGLVERCPGYRSRVGSTDVTLPGTHVAGNTTSN